MIDFTMVICLLPILAGLVLYTRLPERVPTHFDFQRQPNGWSSRPFAVFGLPLSTVGTASVSFTAEPGSEEGQHRAAP